MGGRREGGWSLERENEHKRVEEKNQRDKVRTYCIYNSDP